MADVLLSDSEGGGHSPEELLPEFGADGSQETLPFRHDKTIQQQP